jgi:hypothetical protein
VHMCLHMCVRRQVGECVPAWTQIGGVGQNQICTMYTGTNGYLLVYRVFGWEITKFTVI